MGQDPNPEPQAQLDAAQARPTAAASGHLDEMRDPAAQGGETDAPLGPMTAHWTSFFDHLGPHDPRDLNDKTARLQRQLRDNGVTYNVYADAGGPPRPWSLDLFPFIVTPQSWQQIEKSPRYWNH